MKIAARLLGTALLIAPACAPALATDAANYPARQVRIVLGFAPGGAPDTLARIIGEHLTRAGASRWWWRTGPEPTAISP